MGEFSSACFPLWKLSQFYLTAVLEFERYVAMHDSSVMQLSSGKKKSFYIKIPRPCFSVLPKTTFYHPYFPFHVFSFLTTGPDKGSYLFLAFENSLGEII